MPISPALNVMHPGTNMPDFATDFTSLVLPIETARPWPLDTNGTTVQESPRDARQHTASEWQSKRSLIKRLYIDLDKPLKQVMRIMSEEHNFHATPKMYKTRLTAWDFAKNYTEKRVKDLLHQKRERDAVGKVSKFGGEGQKVDVQRIEKYRKRKKNLKQIISKEVDGIVGVDIKMCTSSAPETPSGQDAPPDMDPAQQFHLPQVPASSHYEQSCPYRPWPNKFRLIEEFSNGSSHKWDSFGHHSYISWDEERDCTLNCLCRRQILSEAFTFIVHKTLNAMEITVFSDGLYSELIGLLGFEDLQLGVGVQQMPLDGLILLKNYHTLKRALSTLHSKHPVDTTNYLLVLEMELLVNGLLADGEVFKSFGYEDLYELKFLDFEHWKEFQQEKLDKDISALEEGFYAIDDDIEELQIPLVDQKSSNLQSTQAEPSVDTAEQVNDLAVSSEELPVSKIQPVSREVIRFGEIFIHVAGTPIYISDMQLAEAAEVGHYFMAQLLLDEGANANGNWCYFPLAEAAKAGHCSIAQLLLDRGADVNGDWYRVPSAEAAEAGHFSIAQLLLDQGADVDGSRYQIPLAEAVKAGHYLIAQLLLDQGANANGDWYHVPLAEAAKAGHYSVAQLLLDRGADVNGNSRQVPLAEAAEAGHYSIAQLLLDRGADVNGNSRQVPLAEAAEAGHYSIAQLLLDRGADVNGNSRQVPLAKAAKAGHYSIAQLLLDRGADVNGNSRQVPLVEAVKAGHEAVALLLLDRGADVNGGWLRSALAEAVTAGHERLVLLLLDRGAGLETDKLDEIWNLKYVEAAMIGLSTDSLLVAAASRGHKPAVHSLLKSGADVNTVSANHSALSAAVNAGHDCLVRLLLQHGADVHTAAIILRGLANTDYALKRLFRIVSQVRNGVAGRSHHYTSEKAMKLRCLHRKFSEQHVLMLKAAQNSSTEFRESSQRFRYRQEAWAAGIKTMRELCRGEPPGNVADTIAFLCLARAISEALATGPFDYNEEFLQDLARWQILFASVGTDLDAYRDAVQSMWGVSLDEMALSQQQGDTCEALFHFQDLATTLISVARESLGFSALNDTGLECSQHRWHLRNSQIFPNTDISDNTQGYISFGASNEQASEAVYLEPPDQENSSNEGSLRDKIEKDVSSIPINMVVVLLMAGAIFAIVLIFLQVLRNISATFNNTSTVFGGIDTLQKRTRNLEMYMDLKVPSVGGPSKLNQPQWGYGSFNDFL